MSKTNAFSRGVHRNENAGRNRTGEHQSEPSLELVHGLPQLILLSLDAVRLVNRNRLPREAGKVVWRRWLTRKVQD